MDNRSLLPLEKALFSSVDTGDIKRVKEAVEVIENTSVQDLVKRGETKVPTLYCVTEKDHNNILAYAIGCKKPNPEIICFLFDKFKHDKNFLLSVNAVQCNLVHSAVTSTNTVFLQLFKDHLEAINISAKEWEALFKFDSFQRTPLFDLMQPEFFSIKAFSILFAMILKTPYPIEIINQSDALSVAISHMVPFEVMKTLIRYGADLNYESYGSDFIKDLENKNILTPVLTVLANDGYLIGKKLPANLVAALRKMQFKNPILLVGCTCDKAVVNVPNAIVSPEAACANFASLRKEQQANILKNCEEQIKIDANADLIQFYNLCTGKNLKLSDYAKTAPYEYELIWQDRETIASIRAEIQKLRDQLAKKSDISLIGKIYNIFSNISLWLGWGGLEAKFIVDAIRTPNPGGVIMWSAFGIFLPIGLTCLNVLGGREFFAQYFDALNNRLQPEEWSYLANMLRNDVINKIKELEDYSTAQKLQGNYHDSTMLDHSSVIRMSLKHSFGRLNKALLPSEVCGIFKELDNFLQALNKTILEINKPFSLFVQPKQNSKNVNKKTDNDLVINIPLDGNGNSKDEENGANERTFLMQGFK